MIGQGRYESGPDFDLLVETVNEILEREGVMSSRGFDLEVKRSESASSYDVNIVTVRFTEGGFRRLFMKDYGSSVRVKHDPVKRRDCEFGVYRDLLGDAGLGTARYLGSRWEAGATAGEGRCWLFLEYVLGTEVRYCAMPAWHASVQWLGRMQGVFASRGEALRRTAFLERHDRAFFERTALRALAAVREANPAVESRVAHVVDRYRAVHAFMAEQPATLVHGAFRPQNLLVRQGSDPPSICPTDWERAAVGSRLFDFGCFAYGFEPPELDRLWASYRAGASESGLDVGGLADARPMLECVYLHRIVNWLAHSAQHRYPPATVERLVNLGQAIAEPQPA